MTDAQVNNPNQRKRRPLRLVLGGIAALTVAAAGGLYFTSNANELVALRAMHHERSAQSDTELAYIAELAFREDQIMNLTTPIGKLIKENGCWVVDVNPTPKIGKSRYSLVVTQLGQLMPHPDGVHSSYGDVRKEGDTIFGHNGAPGTLSGIKVVPKACQHYDNWFYVSRVGNSGELLKKWRGR